MALSHPRTRLGGVLFGPLAKPRYPGDLFYELARESRHAYRESVVLLVLVGAAGLAVMALAPSPEYVLAGLVMALAGAPLAMAVARRWLLRQRCWPASEVLLWWAERIVREWQSIDGGDPPATSEEALSRLDGLSGDLPTALRLPILLASGDRDGVGQELRNWQPSDMVFRARRARLLFGLASDD